MNHKQPLLLIPYLLLVFNLTSLSAAEEQEWELQRDRDGIQVYTRAVEGSPYNAVRTTTVMDNVRLASLVALIEDVDACPDWADRCAESYLYERISETESLIYTHNDMPFPVKDRDVLAQVKWTQNPDSKEVTMKSQATTGQLDEVRGRLRLTKTVTGWAFTPQLDGSVLVSNEAHIDPGSALPGWVINMLLIDTPFETMKSYVNEVQKPKYREAEVSFIQEVTN